MRVASIDNSITNASDTRYVLLIVAITSILLLFLFMVPVVSAIADKLNSSIEYRYLVVLHAIN